MTKVTRDVRTPDIVVITDADGWAVAEDNRAVHTYWRENGMPLAAECDDECQALDCIHPANWGQPSKKAVMAPRELLVQRPEVVEWLRQFPRPVVITPDGDLVEVAEGATVAEVVAAEQ